MNLRPSGYEPDELPDCSTPRHGIRDQVSEAGASGGSGGAGKREKRAGGGLRLSPRLSDIRSLASDILVWRRPTLPRLETQYHWRDGA